MLEAAKRACRVSSDAYNGEIEDLIAAAKADLGLHGVEGEEDDPLIKRAILTYCKANFGKADNYAELKASYDEQKAQMGMATGYTDWGDADGGV